MQPQRHLEAATLFAALFGELIPHPIRADLGDSSQDAYSLFYARSSAMGWLTPATEGAVGGLWGMNDAEADPGPGPQPHRVAWFQVVLTQPAGLPLPAQAFLSCASDVVGRLGTLHLRALQIVLPGQRPATGHAAPPFGMSVTEPLLDACNWFADRDPRLRARVRITLDAGPDPSIRTAAPPILRWLQAIRQEVFVCDSLTLHDDDHLVLEPIPSVEGFGDGHHRVTYRGTLIEWSLDALGWTAAFLADIASRNGVDTTLLLTAERPGPSDPRPAAG